MGVYNPLVDMPESCAECFTRGGSNCFLNQKMSYPNVLYSRNPDCPLVEVKAPHGRLIDADYVSNSFCAKITPVVRMVAEEAPTIIEAEGKDDG